MDNNKRLIELIAELVIKQDQMLTKQDLVIQELKQIKEQVQMNTAAIVELRISNMRLVDIIEKQVFERLSKLEDAVYGR